MHTEKENGHTQAGGAADFGPTTCPSCHGQIVPGTRFCRLCGYRLGEGVEEYAQTRRFDGNAPTTAQQPTATKTAEAHKPGWWSPPASEAGPLATSAQTSALRHEPEPRSKGLLSYCRAGRMSWITWLIVALAIMTALGVVSKKARQWREPAAAVESAPHSALGVPDSDTAEGGGFLVKSVMPDTPVDRAGLIGGDVITRFDGRPVADESALRDMLEETPIGKTVEVVYVRDGETRTTALTTFSSAEMRRGTTPPRGSRGYLGVDVGSETTVPGQNVKGVKLDEVNENRPGYIAGLRTGDIVVEFNGHPVRVEDDLVRRIRTAAPDSVVPVVVIRNGERLEIPVKMGRN